METRLNLPTLTLLLVFAVLGVYYPAIFAPLNSVDDPGMYHYLLNTDSFNLRDLFIPGGKGTYYRPLLGASFLLDKYVWGLEESFMHLQNIILHLCNALLVFAVAIRSAGLLGINSRIPPFLAALLFALHPVNTESVNWISGRTDLLAGFFILLSALLLLRKSMRWPSSILAALCLLIACLAKETAIFFLPPALIVPFFLSAHGEGKPPLRETLLKNAPHFIVLTIAGLGYFLFRAFAFSRGDAGMGRLVTHVAGEQSSGIVLSLRLVLKAAGFYVKKLFIPFPLNFGIIHVSDLYIILGVLLCIAIIWLVARRTLPSFFFISAACLVASALMLPLLKMTWTPLAERYMYLSSAFFLLGMTFSVYGWGKWRSHRNAATLLVASLVAVAIWGTAQRNILWQDNLALFQDTWRKSPDFVPAQNEMANALFALGRTREAGTIIKSMEISEDLNNFQYGLISKSAALVNEGDMDGARKILRQALANPGRHEAQIIQRLLKLNDSEVLSGRAGRVEYYAENVRLLTRLYEITGDPFYQYRLGLVHMFKGERAKARDAFQQVVARATEKVYYHHAARTLLVKMSE